jgi:hypothetical protein
MKYLLVLFHRCHSLSEMPALSNISNVHRLCPIACVAHDRQGS